MVLSIYNIHIWCTQREIVNKNRNFKTSVTNIILHCFSIFSATKRLPWLSTHKSFGHFKYRCRCNGSTVQNVRPGPDCGYSSCKDPTPTVRIDASGSNWIPAYRWMTIVGKLEMSWIIDRHCCLTPRNRLHKYSWFFYFRWCPLVDQMHMGDLPFSFNGITCFLVDPEYQKTFVSLLSLFSITKRSPEDDTHVLLGWFHECNLIISCIFLFIMFTTLILVYIKSPQLVTVKPLGARPDLVCFEVITSSCKFQSHFKLKSLMILSWSLLSIYPSLQKDIFEGSGVLKSLFLYSGSTTVLICGS